jgi:hypothetical protein
LYQGEEKRDRKRKPASLEKEGMDVEEHVISERKASYGVIVWR